jgi:hypothetical protein
MVLGRRLGLKKRIAILSPVLVGKKLDGCRGEFGRVSSDSRVGHHAFLEILELDWSESSAGQSIIFVKHLFSKETSKETFEMPEANAPKETELGEKTIAPRKGMSAGAKLAIVILVVLLIAALGIGIYVWIYRRRTKSDGEDVSRTEDVDSAIDSSGPTHLSGTGVQRPAAGG